MIQVVLAITRTPFRTPKIHRPTGASAPCSLGRREGRGWRGCGQSCGGRGGGIASLDVLLRAGRKAEVPGEQIHLGSWMFMVYVDGQHTWKVSGPLAGSLGVQMVFFSNFNAKAFAKQVLILSFIVSFARFCGSPTG